MPLTETPSLFDLDLTAHESESVEARAARWIESHPEIVAAFVQRARAKANRSLWLSGREIAEGMRGDGALDRPQINNNYVPHLVLHVEDTYPDLRGLFRHRNRDRTTTRDRSTR